MSNLSSIGKATPSGTNPYYMEIAAELRQRLLSGKFKAGQRFFSIRELIDETKRSLPTVRSAFGVLIKEGLLEARQGSGYYATDLIETIAATDPEFLKFMAVIPATSEPDEPWFTAKIGMGMLRRANRDHAMVSFYKRRELSDNSPGVIEKDLARIMALRPDGIAWLHFHEEDAPILNELQKQGIPVVTTIRRFTGSDVPIIQEDNHIYASTILSTFKARGHRRIGIISRPIENNYFKYKLDAFREVAPSFNVEVRDADIFYVPFPDVFAEHQAEALQSFLEERSGVTALLIMAPAAVSSIIPLYDSPIAQRIRNMSLILNVLDGVKVPRLPTGETLATIHPPLKKLGEALVSHLTAKANRCSDNSIPRLIASIEDGDSLKMV